MFFLHLKNEILKKRVKTMKIFVAYFQLKDFTIDDELDFNKKTINLNAPVHMSFLISSLIRTLVQPEFWASVTIRGFWICMQLFMIT